MSDIYFIKHSKLLSFFLSPVCLFLCFNFLLVRVFVRSFVYSFFCIIFVLLKYQPAEARTETVAIRQVYATHEHYPAAIRSCKNKLDQEILAVSFVL